MLGSGLFGLPFEGLICEETVPYLRSRGFNDRDLRKIYLAGGGDPTFYADGDKNFVDLIAVLSKYISNIRLLTGGLNPALATANLIRAKELMGEHCKEPRLIGMVSHHPFGSPDHDERIKRTLECFRDAHLRDLALYIMVFSEEIASQMSPAMRSVFPFLTKQEFQHTPLYSWIVERFRDELAEMNAFFRVLTTGYQKPINTLPRISFLYKESLRDTGRARGLAHDICGFVCDKCFVPRDSVVEFNRKVEGSGIFEPLRVTPHGFITGCDSSKFERSELYEGDLYGHSYEEILHNRRLFLEHLLRDGRAWLERGESAHKGLICDGFCRIARERFAEDVRRIKSHRGEGKTVLKARFAIA